MVKFNSNDDFILYNESGDILLIGVNAGVNNIYTVSKTHVLTGDDLDIARTFIVEHFNSWALYNYVCLEMFVEIPVTLINDFWRKTGLLNAPLSEVLRLIDDGLTHGFEYKVENHMLLCREVLK